MQGGPDCSQPPPAGPRRDWIGPSNATAPGLRLAVYRPSAAPKRQDGELDLAGKWRRDARRCLAARRQSLGIDGSAEFRASDV